MTVHSRGAALHGWWVSRPRTTSDIVLIYYGGNAEKVSANLEWLPRPATRAVLVVNYRGYGDSEGDRERCCFTPMR